MRIVDHRGAAFYELENTMSSFKKTVEMNSYGVEFDVRFTKDNKPVVIHDKTLDRVSYGHGLVSSYTLKDLQDIKTKNNEHILTLEETLDYFKNYQLEINIELKEDKYGIVLDMLKNYNSERIVISSFLHYILPDIKRKGFNTGVLTFASRNPIGLIEKTNADRLHIYYKLINEKLVESVHEKGKEILAWTIDDSELASRMKSMGVDYLCTNKPDILT